MTRLVIVRGQPGAGKSTLSKSLEKSGYEHIEADMYHMNNGKYEWKAENVKASHEWCQRTARACLDAEIDVVVSNTFTTLKEMQPYLDMAKEFGVVPQVVTCQANFGNVHNVPEDTLKAMKARWEEYKI